MPYYLEVPGEVTSSVLRLREILTATLQELPDGSAAVGSVRAACKRFLNEPRPDYRNAYPRYRGGWEDREEFSLGFLTALGELRAAVGTHIAALACQYGIDVEEELASVLPLVDEA